MREKISGRSNDRRTRELKSSDGPESVVKIGIPFVPEHLLKGNGPFRRKMGDRGISPESQLGIATGHLHRLILRRTDRGQLTGESVRRQAGSYIGRSIGGAVAPAAGPDGRVQRI